jgi:hypothetical protein
MLNSITEGGSNEIPKKSAPFRIGLALALVGLISAMALPGYSRNQPAITGGKNHAGIKSIRFKISFYSAIR